MDASELKPGAHIHVPYGTRTHDATVIDVRDGRVYVAVDPDSDSPVETFYRQSELVTAPCTRCAT
jgi:hypothetical protein